AQLHELAEHALVGFGPQGHRFDRLSRELPEELLGLRHVRHVRLLPDTVLRPSISRRSVTRRVRECKRIFIALRQTAPATVRKVLILLIFSGGGVWPRRHSHECSGGGSRRAAAGPRRNSSWTRGGA